MDLNWGSLRTPTNDPGYWEPTMALRVGVRGDERKLQQAFLNRAQGKYQWRNVPEYMYAIDGMPEPVEDA